jgi:hypothetical protein
MDFIRRATSTGNYKMTLRRTAENEDKTEQ